MKRQIMALSCRYAMAIPMQSFWNSIIHVNML